MHRTFLQRGLIKRVSPSPGQKARGVPSSIFPSTLSRFPRSHLSRSISNRARIKRKYQRDLNLTEAFYFYYYIQTDRLRPEWPMKKTWKMPRALQIPSFETCTEYLSNFILANKHMDVRMRIFVSSDYTRKLI